MNATFFNVCFFIQIYLDIFVEFNIPYINNKIIDIIADQSDTSFIIILISNLLFTPFSYKAFYISNKII